MRLVRGEYRTAIVMGVVITVAIAGITITFSILEDRAGTVFEPGDGTGLDKSRFRMAPALAGIAGYVNTTPEDLAQSMEDKVVLYDVWTYSCVNCVRTIPHLAAWDEKYSDEGLLIIGIHSPEFEFEKDEANVKMAVEKHGVAYPVVLDNEKETWKAFGNRYWPSKYIADHEGYIRYYHIGEGAYDDTEWVIKKLLAERAAFVGIKAGNASAGDLVEIQEFDHSASRTPELYFGYYFAQGRDRLGNAKGFVPGTVVSYEIPDSVLRDRFYLSGDWANHRDGMSLSSDSGTILLYYYAKEVNIVAGGGDKSGVPTKLRITLDGSKVPQEQRGTALDPDGTAHIRDHDLYNLISSDSAGKHLLKIDVSGTGFEIFTFTFG